MAMIEPQLVAYLIADTALAAALTSADGTQRIYPAPLPQKAVVPALTYARIFSEYPDLVDGNPSLIRAQFQFSCWAESAKAAAELAAKLRARMSGVGGSGFQKSQITDERSDFETDTKLYRQDVDVEIFYEASAPS